MVEKVVKIVADTAEATKEIKDLFNTMVDEEKKAQKETEKLQKEVSDIGKSTKNAEKGVKSIGKAFSGVGLAIKAMGIGLLLSALATMKDLFSQNQRVVDAFSTAFETASIVVNEVSNALFNVYDSVSQNKEGFDALGKVLMGVLNLALTPTKLIFQGIKLTINQAQLAWEKSFFGGKDKDRIKELNKSIQETALEIGKIAGEAVKSGKDIVTNFSEAITEATEIGTKAVTELSKVSISSAYEQAKVNTQLKNGALLAQAEQTRLVEIYDRQAEKLRQIRDNDLTSIEDRKKANEELSAVLEKQEKAMIASANAQVASAQATLNTNNSIENQVALTEALANKEGVLAQIEGFRSEQLANRNALKREEIQLNTALSDAEKERQIRQLEFEAGQEEKALVRLEKQRENLLLENDLLLEDLEAKREIYAEGTQARVDAEIEYQARKQEIENELTKNQAEQSAERTKIEQAEAVAKKATIDQTGKVLENFSAIAGEQTAIGKGLAVASATINTYRGVSDALAAQTVTPFETALKFANAAAIGIAGLQNVGKIVSTEVPTVKGASGGGGASVSAPAPSFNLVQGSGTNQIAESIGNQSQPIQAYVVSGNVTTAQSLDRNAVESSSI